MTPQTDNPQEVRAGIVLCGGLSSRMGRSKADLPFGEESMLQRVVRLLSQTVNEIVVVAAPQQVVPDMGTHVTVARDEIEHAGPLAGLAIGLAELHARAVRPTAAFATACDVPFLSPRFVETLFDSLNGHDVAVPVDDEHHYPLAAVYRTQLSQTVRDLVSAGERRPRALFDYVRTFRLPTTALDRVDDGLQTLTNLNTPEHYKAALGKAGYAIPDWLNP